MKHIQFVKAFKTLQKISNYELPVREAYQVFRLLKELQPIHEFAERRERQLIEKYQGEITESGAINFIHGDDDEAREDGIKNMNMCADEIRELNETEIEETFSPITLKYDALGNQKLTANEIMALDGFIFFE